VPEYADFVPHEWIGLDFMNSLVDPSFSRVIGELYDCVLDPGGWSNALAALTTFVGCDRAILSLSDLRQDRFVIHQSHGWESCWLEQRARHAPEIHSALHNWLSRRAVTDDPFVASRHIPAEVMRKSAYVRECLAPMGIRDVAHFFLVRSADYFSDLALFQNGSSEDSVLMAAQLENAKLVLPHLRRAVLISNVMNIFEFRATTASNLLDTLSCAAFMTSLDGVVLHANARGETLLCEGDCVKCVSGVLRATSSSANIELREAIRQCASDVSRAGHLGVSVPMSDTLASPVVAHVLPLTPDRLRRMRSSTTAVAAIFVRGADAISDSCVEGIAASFRLTPAEARVLGCLLAGLSLVDAATKLKVRRATVKTQLEGIFRKTGATRQSDLIRLA
jgi:DNA-binding CsgD family transcriptional regulator